MQQAVTASMIRGGTSKGLVIPAGAVPPRGPELDDLLIRLMGSPDRAQIDGLGASTSTTNKVMIVDHSPDAQGRLHYLFAQLAPDRPIVDYGGNCGNMTAAVATYVVEQGLVTTGDGVTEVRLYNDNTDKEIRATVPTPGGVVTARGDHMIAGIPWPGAEIVTRYMEPCGSVFQGMFPTGQRVDSVTIPSGQTFEVSFVDVTNPLVFVRAEDIGLAGHELPEQLNEHRDFLALAEEIRGACAVRLGLVDEPAQSAMQSPSIPKLALVAPPRDYVTSGGNPVGAEEYDVLGRIMSVQKVHHAYALSGVMCTGSAALIEGTIPHDASPVESPAGAGSAIVRVGHPKGVARTIVELDPDAAGGPVVSTSVTRTARTLFTGVALPRPVLK